MGSRNLWVKILSALGFGGAAAYAAHRWVKKRDEGTPNEVIFPLGKYTVFETENVPPSSGWKIDMLDKPHNGMREKGKRYMARISRLAGGGSAVVEGTWRDEDSPNNVPLMLKIDRVVSIKGSAFGGTPEPPAVPFMLRVPESNHRLENDYLEGVRWESLHPSSVSAPARSTGKPKPGTVVRYAMRESNSLGDAVIVIEGQVMPDDSAYWPKNEGSPDSERVLVSAPDIVRTVRGRGSIALPPVFVVPVENLFA